MATELDLEVQVGPGGFAPITDLSNLLARVDLLAGLNEVSVVVPVGADHVVGVPDANPESVAGSRPSVDDGAVCGGNDRAPDGGGNVLPAVKFSTAVPKTGGASTV